MTDRRTDGRTDGIVMAYTRYSIYAVARKKSAAAARAQIGHRKKMVLCAELYMMKNDGNVMREAGVIR